MKTQGTKQNLKMHMIKATAMIAVIMATVTANAAKTMNLTTAFGSSIQADFPVTEKGSVNAILGLSSGGTGIGVGYNQMFTQPILASGWSANSHAMYYTGDTKGYSVGALAQYNAFWDNGFNMNAGIGLQYVKLEASALSTSIRLTGMLPDLGFNIGYSF